MEEQRVKANLKLSKKYFPSGKRQKIDTVANTGHFGKRNEVLMDAFRAWSMLDEWRRIASRNERYTFGDQWSDRVPDPEGSGYITEKELIRRQGNQALINNRIRSTVRTVLGVFSSTRTEPICIARTRQGQRKGEMMSATLQYVYQNNKLNELDRRNLEYMLLTGAAVFRSSYGWRMGKNDVWTDIVNYNDFFFDNHMKDPRHWDCHMVGQIWDLGIYDVIAQFADGSKEKGERLREIYSHCDRDNTISYIENLTRDVQRHKNFFVPDDETRCRVIEIWKRESKERLRVHDTLTGELYKTETEELAELKAENERRTAEQRSMGVTSEDMKLLEWEWFIDNYWYFYFLSPQGDVLHEGESPYWHESHPYSFKIYPFYNSRVYPFVSDFIDQQRHINRTIMLQDFLVRASAKGVLMFPEELLTDDMTKEDVCEEWVKYNGVIFYKAKAGVQLPQQIIASSTHLGLMDMLSIQLRLFEDISGVQGALQGQAPQSGTPASLYMQETQNSATSLTDLFESNRSVREERDYKNLKLIQQYYTEPRYINVSNSNNPNTGVEYKPDEVRNAEFNLSISESTATPAYRMVMNDLLMQFFNMGQITLKEVLEAGSFPFADKLLQMINSRQEAAQETASLDIPADIQQQIQQGTQPEVLDMLNATNTTPNP